MDEEKEPRWCFWKHTIIGDGATVYMKRLTLLATPWFSVKLHKIFRADGQRELHDHPWNFLSVVLWGTYVEETITEPREVVWFNWKKAEDSHSISWVSTKPVVTLVFCGPVKRTWGFWVKKPTEPKAKTVSKCMSHFYCAHTWVPFYSYEKLDQP